LAARMISAFDADLQAKLDTYMADMAQQVLDAKL
jgi:phosphoribosylcarboxyaminoimidazole (NCAIR) mutase